MFRYFQNDISLTTTLPLFFLAETGSGGALRLSGQVTMRNLTFNRNRAAAGGLAVSNIGSIVSVTDITFVGSTFFCDAGTYADYFQVSNESKDPVYDGPPNTAG